MEKIESASDLFRTLNRLHVGGDLGFRYDFKRLQQMDSPVASEADGNIWAYATLAAALAVLWWWGWSLALLVGAGGTLTYFTLGTRYVRSRIKRRVEVTALGDLDLWQRLWRFGGIALVTRGGELCEAPSGNWMALMRNVTRRTQPLDRQDFAVAAAAMARPGAAPAAEP